MNKKEIPHTFRYGGFPFSVALLLVIGTGTMGALILLEDLDEGLERLVRDVLRLQGDVVAPRAVVSDRHEHLDAVDVALATIAGDLDTGHNNVVFPGLHGISFPLVG